MSNENKCIHQRIYGHIRIHTKGGRQLGLLTVSPLAQCFLGCVLFYVLALHSLIRFMDFVKSLLLLILYIDILVIQSVSAASVVYKLVQL